MTDNDDLIPKKDLTWKQLWIGIGMMMLPFVALFVTFKLRFAGIFEGESPETIRKLSAMVEYTFYSELFLLLITWVIAGVLCSWVHRQKKG